MRIAITDRTIRGVISMNNIVKNFIVGITKFGTVPNITDYAVRWVVNGCRIIKR